MVVGPLIVLVIAAQAGNLLVAQLADRHPLALIALNARNANLVLVTNQLDPVGYYLVGAARLLVSDPLFYVLGYWYGDAGIAWLERNSPTFGRLLRQWEDAFSAAAHVLVFIAPNNPICLFAGASGMRPATFAALNVSGTFVRLYLIRRVGDAFSSPIDSVLDFIGQYRLQLTALSFVLVGLTVWNDRRKGTSEIDTLAHLDEAARASGPDPVEQDPGDPDPVERHPGEQEDAAD
jgi:membrane protein DedA with SNARE-associated domain